jgi:hypothetical protein
MWRKATKDDLFATLSKSEAEACERSSDFGSDVIELILSRTAEFARSFLRRNPAVKMCPLSGTLPEGLISPAMDYAAFDILKRHKINVGDDRRKARQDALDIFERAAQNHITPESYQDEGETDIKKNEIAATPMAGEAKPFRLLD